MNRLAAWRLRWQIGAGALVLLASLSYRAAPAAESAADNSGAKAAFIYRTPQGIELQVTADGLSSIRSAGRQLAKGSWSAFNAEPWFKDSGSGKVDAKEIREKSLSVVDEKHARVRQVKGDLLCVFDYTFDGEDVLISARIENNNSDQPLNVVGFSGLEFHFQRPPAGLMMVQHITYFQAHGVKLCHPGDWAKIGGSYAEDDSVGVGLSPWKTGFERTLFLWDYADWRPDKRENLPDRRLIYFAVAPIPARGARTVEMKLRVSTDIDWKHLLAPYREHFQETYGPVRYKADNRWIATDYLNASQQAVSAENPYGFHGGARRFDKAEGVAKFCDELIPALKRAGGQGVIVWGQGGDDPRGAMYRPDFDVLPPEVEANWPTLAKRFRAAGLKIGVCTRPADIAVRRDWKTDDIISLAADDPSQREMILRRFRTMTDKGCTLFYLDSFGSDLENVKLMRAIREQLGPDALTFTEHQCDAMLAYSGGYSEATFHAGAPGKEPSYSVWSGLDNWEIYRWLVPGAQLVSRLYQVEGKIPDGFEPVDRFFFSHHVTPLLPVSDIGRVKELEKLQPTFVDAAGGWRR